MKTKKCSAILGKKELELDIKRVEETLECAILSHENWKKIGFTCLLLEAKLVSPKSIKIYQRMMDVNDGSCFHLLHVRIYGYQPSGSEMNEIRLTALCFLHTLLCEKLSRKSR